MGSVPEKGQQGPPANKEKPKELAAKRRWPLSRRKELEKDLAHVNQEIYSKNLELAQTNKTLALLQTIDGLVLGDQYELRPLCVQLTQRVVGELEYPFVAIMGYPSEGRGDLEMYGWSVVESVASESSAFVDAVHLRSDLRWFKSDERIKFVRLDTKSDAEIARYCRCSELEARTVRKAMGLSSLCVVKLSARKQLVGIMIIGFDRPHDNGVGTTEEALFMRLSEAIGIAVDHKLILEENQQVLRQLEASNKKLRKLDQTKDDFISMASHQLRTPLTSVKGYVSMVLDGDAGKISQLQRKLLNQSFVSSQRMVYLISDLLNVSRLRTGKFIIEPVQSNLASVVEEEVSQLIETAKGRHLELKYDKPTHFPLLMLDETKVRQVIMNFIDNAVYYTPSGGHIEVRLIDKPESIEFLVTDDGIGVPRHEQMHLFTKFFRANNAKRARPDGTGLGLFMAKKVIIAQGGAVIFRSQEGAGSTFGFTFAKSKLLPPKS